MPSKSNPSGQSGQILPLGLAFLFVACLGFFLLISLGRTLVARERHRMQVDLTAHAVAIDMARGLNVAAMINKVHAGIVVSQLLYPPVAYLSHLDLVQNIDAGVKVADKIPVATALYVGIQNGLLPIPLWSHGGQAQPSLEPTLNLRRRYIHGSLADLWNKLRAALPGGASSSDTSADAADTSRYSYHRKADGTLVQVDPDQVEQITFRDRWGHLRTQVRKRDPISGKVKFVKDDGAQDLLPLDLVETGPHRITIIGRADNAELFDSRLLPRPEPQWVVASAEAGGGDVELLASDPNADFDAYLIPVERGLALGPDLQKGFALARSLRFFGVSLPDDLSGWTLIAH